MTTKRAILTSASALTLLNTGDRYAFTLHPFGRGREGFLTHEARDYDTVLSRQSLETTFLSALIGNAIWLTLRDWITRSLTFAPRQGETA